MDLDGGRWVFDFEIITRVCVTPVHDKFQFPFLPVGLLLLFFIFSGFLFLSCCPSITFLFLWFYNSSGGDEGSNGTTEDDFLYTQILPLYLSENR